MPEHPDLQRLRTEYAVRARQVDTTDRYSLFNVSQLFLIQQRQRVILKCLKGNGFFPLSERRILELGCGSGGVLFEFLSAGALSGNLHGADLIFDRVQAAHQNLGGLPLACADGRNLPYPARSFDLTLQFTVFSSILDDEVKTNVAGEMLRVTRPGGLILWYDFWLNPSNLQTRGIRPPEIRGLFPGCDFEFHRITLAPPIARRSVPISWIFSSILEKLVILNSHFLVAIKCP